MTLPDKIYLEKDQIEQVINEIDGFMIDIDSVDYNEDLIKGYKRIVVVGLQRSGTTFTSQAFSNTLNFTNVDEGEFRVRDVNLFKEIMKRENIVVQAPAMTCRIQSFVNDDDLVVFMYRKWSDIIKSVYKKNNSLSNWILMDTMYDIEKYYFTEYDPECEKYYDKHVNRNSYYLDSYYNMWKHYQSKKIKNCITLNYDSMKIHPMWIDKSSRSNFHAKQTSI